MTVYISGTTGYSGPVGVLGDLTTTGNTILGDQSTDTLNVANGNLVLDSSGNLGIGIAPATTARRLVVYGSTGSSTATSLALQNSTSGTGTTDGFTMELDGATAYLWNYENANLIFGTNNTERMRLDSSGNLGLGVTPSTWGNGVSLQGNAWSLSTTSGFDSGALAINARQTAYGGGSTNWVYRGSARASSYEQTNGQHIWFNAASGTAGNAITFTQAMTLDSSGDLGIGLTPSAWRSGGGVLEINASTNGYIAINNGGGGILQNAYRDASNFVYKNTGTASYFQIGSDGSYTWNRAVSGAAGSAITFAQPMTLDASSNLTVTGYVRPAGMYSVNGGSVVAADSAMPTTANSLGYTLANGPGSNDGHILGMTWTSPGIYGAQIWVDTDPTYFMATRGRTNLGVWNSWVNILNTGVYRQYLATPGASRSTSGVLVSVSITVNNASNRIFITACDLMRCSSGYIRAQLRRNSTSIEDEFMYQQVNGNIWQTTTGMYTGTNFPTGTYTMDLYANFDAGAGAFDGPSYFQVTVWDGI
jgi:hypothetical protein